jgi:hypothetical protein
MRRVLIPLVSAAFFTLCGCDTISGWINGQPQITLDPGPVCPATGVLSDAASVTKLRPGTPAAMTKPADVSFQALMSQAQLDCNYDRVANTLVVNVKFAIKASRGPALSGANPQLPFFVAIIDADNNVLVKNVYNSDPQMSGRPSATYTETVSNFPVPLAEDRRPSDYEILTGFQLTPDELAYNRLPRVVPTPQAVMR